MRILGLCIYQIQNLSMASGIRGDTATVFSELARSHEVILRSARITGIKGYCYKLCSILVGRRNWREFYRKAARAYDERSKIAYQEVYRLRNSIDLVFQTQGMFSPFIGEPLKPHVIYTDYTVALAARSPHYKTFFQMYPKEREKWFARERQNYQNAARILTYSDRVRHSMIQDYGVDPEKVVTVRVGVRVELAPENWVKCYDDNRIIFIGHDSAFERKGGPNLLQAFKLVQQKIPDAELMLVGVHPNRNIRQPGVRVLGFIRDRKRIDELLESASLFAMTPLLEPFGLVFLEAMAKKLPCVGSAVDAVPEIIVDGETGRLVPPEDPETLARTLMELLSDKDKLKRMGENGYNRVRRMYTWDKVMAKIEENLQQCAPTSCSS